MLSGDWGCMRLLNGDSRELLKTLDADSIDSCVCDPPYHLTSITKRFGKADSAECQFGTDGAYKRASRGFMGKEWDGGDIAFDPTFWREVWRVLKPGAHLLACGGTRTYHRMVCAIEDADFEIRDCITWNYGTGFPKSHDVSKGIDKLNGALRSNGIPGPYSSRRPSLSVVAKNAYQDGVGDYGSSLITQPITDEAVTWSGWGSALKPSVELIVMARKPLAESSIARNVLAHGTGGLNIDACRIGTDDNLNGGGYSGGAPTGMFELAHLQPSEFVQPSGRWPANTILGCNCATAQHDKNCAVAILDAQSGVSSSGAMAAGTLRANQTGFVGLMPQLTTRDFPGDSGGASRFFFTAKPSRRERGETNIHPTVKPVALMAYLCRLITPPGGTVLDPFAGSGTTGIGASIGGFDSILIERELEYYNIALDRNGHWREYVDDPQPVIKPQLSMFGGGDE